MANFNLLFAARFDEETATMLRTLCSKRRMSRSAVLRAAVRDSFVAMDAVGRALRSAPGSERNRGVVFGPPPGGGKSTSGDKSHEVGPPPAGA